ncbi:MAG: hypothetical protein Q9174_003756 [Haloplaca sp. 1 TL-2023]
MSRECFVADCVLLGLDDLCVRFIINLPQEELESVERICFQVEEAQWYYEDFIRPLDPDLPSLNLRNFCLRIFQHCPLLSEFSPYHHAAAFEEFLAYKTRVPVRGAIMLNEDMDEVVLVKGWKKGSNWSFPRGKINKDESDLDCAMREVYEETGFDVQRAGLVKEPDDVKYIDVAIQHQHLRLYVFRGVPMDTPFEARTRKEISKIDWWKLSDLPTLRKKKQQEEGRGETLASNANRFYMVAPFLVPLKKWISQQKKAERLNGANGTQQSVDHQDRESVVEDDVPPGTEAVAASGDMERLLAGLRQPAVNHNIEHEHATSSIKTSATEASMQLKNLLCVPTKEPSRSAARTDQTAQASSKVNTVDGKKSASLLALLKGGPPSQQSQIPQTPMEQMIEPPSMPESPKHHHKAIPPIPHHQPPPSFPGNLENTHPIDKGTMNGVLSSSNKTHVAGLQQNPISAWSNFQSTIAQQDAERNKAAAARRAARLDEEEKSGGQQKLSLPSMSETWRQVKVQEDGDMGHASQRRVVKVTKRPTGGNTGGDTIQGSQGSPLGKTSNDTAVQSMPAPYQATSTSHVGSGSQYPDIYRPAIPAANKLPMPKLTAHSSSLLNLFKDGKTLKKATHDTNIPNNVMEKPSVGEAVDHSMLSKQDEHTPQKQDSREAPKSVHKPPGVSTSNVDDLIKAKRPQSAHQATLLGLFGKPSTPKGQPTPPAQSISLEVPANLVELSALPSPGHSREPSRADTKISKTIAKATAPDPGMVQKRSRADVKQGNLPVSATVNGPLNIPQFDMIAQKTRESHQKPAATKEAVKKSPVTILARPVGSKPQGTGELPKPSKSNGESTIAVDEPISKPSKSRTEQTPPSKPFQPQILRRPPPEADEPKNSPVEPQTHTPKTPKSTLTEDPSTRTIQAPIPTEIQSSPSPVSATERQPPKTKPDHKATLLSLFTKSPSSPNAASPGPSATDLSAFVSPVAAKPPTMSFPTVPMGERVKKAGMMPGSANGEVGKSEPSKKVAKDSHKTFLLGYLDKVARDGGR